MIGIFRRQYLIYFLSMGLFLGFGLKTAISITSKLSCMFLALEDEQPSEEENSAKDEQSGRSLKKMLFFEIPKLDKLSGKDPIAWEAHNRVYLLAIVPEPVIVVPVEPPELG